MALRQEAKSVLPRELSSLVKEAAHPIVKKTLAHRLEEKSDEEPTDDLAHL